MPIPEDAITLEPGGANPPSDAEKLTIRQGLGLEEASRTQIQGAPTAESQPATRLGQLCKVDTPVVGIFDWYQWNGDDWVFYRTDGVLAGWSLAPMPSDTEAYTLTTTDHWKILVFNTLADATVTIPFGPGLEAGSTTRIINLGQFVITIETDGEIFPDAVSSIRLAPNTQAELLSVTGSETIATVIGVGGERTASILRTSWSLTLSDGPGSPATGHLLFNELISTATTQLHFGSQDLAGVPPSSIPLPGVGSTILVRQDGASSGKFILFRVDASAYTTHWVLDVTVIGGDDELDDGALLSVTVFPMAPDVFLPLAGGQMTADSVVSYPNGAVYRQGQVTNLNPDGLGYELVCSAGFVYLFMNGQQYALQQDGYTVRAVHQCAGFPDVNMDEDHGYVVGSRRYYDDGRVYECTDSSVGAAVWRRDFSGKSVRLITVADDTELAALTSSDLEIGDLVYVQAPAILPFLAEVILELWHPPSLPAMSAYLIHPLGDKDWLINFFGNTSVAGARAAIGANDATNLDAGQVSSARIVSAMAEPPAIGEDTPNVVVGTTIKTTVENQVYGLNSGVNFERLCSKWNAGVTAFQIGTEKGGTGQTRSLELLVNGAVWARITSTGTTLAVDNTTTSFFSPNAATAQVGDSNGRGVTVRPNGGYCFSYDVNRGEHIFRDTGMHRNGAGFVKATLGDHNAALGGFEAATLSAYNYFTSALVFERLCLKYNAGTNAFQIGTEKGASGGSPKPLEILTNGVVHLTLGTTGTFKSQLAGGGAPTILVASDWGIGPSHLGTGMVLGNAAGAALWCRTFSAVSMATTGVFGWADGGGWSGALNTAFSRISVGVVGVGNGTAGDFSGFMQDLYRRMGSGSPEGVVTAPVGATYHRTDGGAGTSFYVKESGAGNTGWVAK